MNTGEGIMVDVRRLIREADPLPGRHDGSGLSRRATEHLVELLASVPPGDSERGGAAGGVGAGGGGADGRTTGRSRATVRRLTMVLTATAGVLALVGALIATGMWLSQPQPPTANEPVYVDTASLESHADVIVRGVLESARDESFEGNLETVARVRLGRVAKGNAKPDDVLAVNYTSPASGAAEAPTGLRVGGEYVFLIEWSPGGRAYLVNSTQGYYVVRQGRAVATKDNPISLSSGVRHALGLA
jgi:hypothetical protein